MPLHFKPLLYGMEVLEVSAMSELMVDANFESIRLFLPGILVCYDPWDRGNTIASKVLRGPNTIWRITANSSGSFYDLGLVDNPHVTRNIHARYLRHYMPRTWREKRQALARALAMLPEYATPETGELSQALAKHYGYYQDPAQVGAISTRGNIPKQTRNALERSGILPYLRKGPVPNNY